MMVKVLETKSYKEQLKDFRKFGPEKKRLGGGGILVAFQFLSL